jgi:hypothetical protein
MAVVTGTNFQPGAQVTFGGSPASNVLWLSTTSISCSPPPHAAGVVDVTVTNPDGSSATGIGAYTYGLILPPNVSSIVGWYKGDVGYGAGAWQDQSTIGNNLTLTGTSVGASLNGHATVHFAGGTDKATIATFNKTATGSITIGVVFNVANATANYTAVAYDDGAFDTTLVGTLITSGFARYEDFLGTEIAGTANLVGAWKKIMLTATKPSPTNGFLYENNVSDGAAVNATQQNIASGIPLVIGHSNLNGRSFVGDIAEVIIYPTVLNSTDLGLLNTYFGTKYSI